MSTLNAVKVKLQGGPLDGAEATLPMPLPSVHGFGASIAVLRVGAFQRGRACEQWIAAPYSARRITYVRVGDDRLYVHVPA